MEGEGGGREGDRGKKREGDGGGGGGISGHSSSVVTIQVHMSSILITHCKYP